MIVSRILAQIGFGFLFSFAVTSGAGSPEERVAVSPALPTTAADRVFVLPPIFVVDAQFIWRYAKLPGMEFLSCTDQLTTAELIERIYNLNQQLDAFVPPQLRVNLVVPTSFVFFGEGQEPVDLQKMVAAVRQSQADAKPGTAEALTIHYLPNFRFWEQDEMAVFFVVKDDAAGAGSVHLSPDYVRYTMENRTPALPRWFIDGMMALYPGTSLQVEPVTSHFFTASSETAPIQPYRSVSVRLPRWMFGFKTSGAFIRSDGWKTKIPPISVLFAAPPARGDGWPGTDPTLLTRADGRNAQFIDWWSESALFIHWALHRRDGKARAAFWKFVERASVEPVTEGMFHEYFGLNYAEMKQTLIDYLPDAVTAVVQLEVQASSAMPAVELYGATPTQISRIKGNLERLEIAYVQAKYPALADKYLAQARRTLQRAFDRGDRDTGLLEALGLCECDAGNDARARQFLELAVEAQAVRPRVYYELARLRYQLLRTKNADAKFNADQTAGLLRLLSAARSHPPPINQVYELIASVWLQSAVAPSRENLAVLDEGLRLFPQNLRLIYFSAVLQASRGFNAEATRLINLGLQLAPEGAERSRLLKLQSALAVTPPKNT